MQTGERKLAQRQLSVFQRINLTPIPTSKQRIDISNFKKVLILLKTLTFHRLYSLTFFPLICCRSEHFYGGSANGVQIQTRLGLVAFSVEFIINNTSTIE